MFMARSFTLARLLLLVGGFTLTASLTLAQPPGNAGRLPSTPTKAPATPVKAEVVKPASLPTNVPAGAGVVRIQSTTPATLPESTTAPATPTAPVGPAPVMGAGCPTGGCAPATAPVLKGQPTDPCGPRSSFDPEIPTMPVGRNTGRGCDGLGFGPCRVPCLPGAGTGVTFKQCWNNAINISRTPAIMANPNGTFTRMAFERQKLNALAEYFVIYKEEFEPDGKTLTPSGFRHLCGIVRRLEECRPIPIQIEVEDVKKDIADNRKLAVVQAMMKLGVDSGLAISRVEAINYCAPRAEGLRYEAIEQVGTGATQLNSGGTGGNLGGGFGR